MKAAVVCCPPSGAGSLLDVLCCRVHVECLDTFLLCRLINADMACFIISTMYCQALLWFGVEIEVYVVENAPVSSMLGLM